MPTLGLEIPVNWEWSLGILGSGQSLAESNAVEFMPQNSFFSRGVDFCNLEINCNLRRSSGPTNPDLEGVKTTDKQNM